MSTVYFKPIESYDMTTQISAATTDLLKIIEEKEQVELQKFIPLKVHLGEKGNTTFIQPQNFQGIIDYLHSKSIDTAFLETNVLYRGQRNSIDKHLNLAK